MVTPFVVSNVFFCLIFFTIKVETWGIFGSKAFVADKQSTCMEDQSKSGVVSLPFNPLTHTTILVRSTYYNPTQCFFLVTYVCRQSPGWEWIPPAECPWYQSASCPRGRCPGDSGGAEAEGESRFENATRLNGSQFGIGSKRSRFLAVRADLRFLWRRPSWSTGSGSPWIWRVRPSTNRHPDRR